MVTYMKNFDRMLSILTPNSWQHLIQNWCRHWCQYVAACSTHILFQLKACCQTTLSVHIMHMLQHFEICHFYTRHLAMPLMSSVGGERRITVCTYVCFPRFKDTLIGVYIEQLLHNHHHHRRRHQSSRRLLYSSILSLFFMFAVYR